MQPQPNHKMAPQNREALSLPFCPTNLQNQSVQLISGFYLLIICLTGDASYSYAVLWTWRIPYDESLLI